MKITILRTKDGWVVGPDQPGFYAASGKAKDPTKVKAFIYGQGWKTRKILETREIETLPEDYTFGQIEEMAIRYGDQVTKDCVEKVFKGAGICVGSEIALARSLSRVEDEDAAKFQQIFGRSWRSFLEGFSTMFGTPCFDIIRFNDWCVKEQGYVDNAGVSLQDFVRQKWGAEVLQWFQDRILNVEPAA